MNRVFYVVKIFNIISQQILIKIKHLFTIGNKPISVSLLMRQHYEYAEYITALSYKAMEWLIQNIKLPETIIVAGVGGDYWVRILTHCSNSRQTVSWLELYTDIKSLLCANWWNVGLRVLRIQLCSVTRSTSMDVVTAGL